MKAIPRNIYTEEIKMFRSIFTLLKEQSLRCGYYCIKNSFLKYISKQNINNNYWLDKNICRIRCRIRKPPFLLLNLKGGTYKN